MSDDNKVVPFTTVRKTMPERAEPTVQLCVNDDELEALREVLEAVPIVKNFRVMPVLLDIINGNYITLDTD